MKRSPFGRQLKPLLLAVPAAALMLGAAHAGTTVGLNFQSWYYDSGTTPQTIGFGAGYQTTGFPVTATAFGVAPANWVNTDPLNCSAPVALTLTFGSITGNFSAENPWESNIGNLETPADEWDGPASVLPGNDEVTWSFEDNTGWTNNLSGLDSEFPNGYVIELIGAEKCTSSSRVVVSDGATFTNSLAFNPIYTAGNANFNGPVGLLTLPQLTSDSLTFGAVSRDVSSAQSCALAGFIITDEPVVTQDPPATTVNQGGTLTLTATIIGLTNGVAYQWQLNGVAIPGATNAAYTKVGVTTAADQGNYDVVVTNLYGTATSGTAAVTVNAIAGVAKNLTGGTSTIFAGANFSSWSVVGSGALPLSYQWYKGGVAVAGATNSTLTLSNVTVGSSGSYAVKIVNSFGSATSATNQLVVAASPNLYTTDVAKDAPDAFWPLNDSSGSALALDYSGNGDNGTNDGGLTEAVPGPLPPENAGFDSGSLAYQFDGGSSYIDCGTGPSVSGTNDFTVEAWVNTTAGSAGTIIQQRSPSGYNGEYQFSTTAQGNLSFYIYGGGYQFDFTTTRVINDGLWHDVVAVRSGQTGSIYIDGTLAGSASGASIAPLDPTIETYIGSDVRGTTTFFSGSMADVAVYPYALSVHQITLHAYNGQLGNAPFSLSFVSGGYILDSKPVGALQPGLNLNASWTNAFTDGNSVTRSGVEVFDGASQIAIPAASNLSPSNGTIMFWVLANAPISGPGSEGAMLYDCRTTNGAVIYLNDDGSIHWQGQNGSRNEFEAGYVPDGNWHHVAVTYGQTTSDSISIYIDGSLAGSVAVTNAWSWPAGQEIEVGRSHDSYWQVYNGLLDDFRIYNRVLTPTEIASVQSSDALVDTSALMVRYNFDTAGGGTSLNWPVGSLYTSPVLGPSAVWTVVPNAVPPYPVFPPATTPPGASLFYRAGF